MISIIVPVYNAKKYILKTIETVREQTFTDWELLLVDDCSSDGSGELIKEYIDNNPPLEKKIRYIRHERNKGAAGTRNTGLKEANGRYIAFLDADDIWYPEKLSVEMQFMEKHDAGLVYSAYEFGDENGVPNGRMVRVPKTLTYRQALTRTIIFTSTVLIDTEIIDKELVYMPGIASEDTATWWNILKEGHIAYGLNQPLVIYRRPEQSLSSNKGEAIKRIWNLYIKIAEVSAPQAAFYLIFWAVRAGTRRFIADRVRGKVESFKRFTVVQLSVIGLVLYTAIYAYAWFNELYPILSAPRISLDGYNLGAGLKLYFKGHILIILVYFLILFFMSHSAGGLRTGYIKPSGIFVSEVTALVITNAITYLQLSLMHNWLMPAGIQIGVLLVQILVAGVWSLIADAIYRAVFPPRETLVLELSGAVKAKETEALLERLRSRQDRFRIMKVMEYDGDIERIKKECLRWYGCVVISGGTDELRKAILEFCYMHLIRAYITPDLGDVLIQGTGYADIFDMPVFELREYSIRWEERLVKRSVDLAVGCLMLLITSPVIICKLLMGSRITFYLCRTRGNRKFRKYRFDDDGKLSGIPVCMNLVNGTMSIVGPSTIKCGEEPSKDYRCRMKPGIIGYYQIFGDADAPVEDIVKMDIFYIQHFALMNDFKLMLQAVRCAVARK